MRREHMVRAAASRVHEHLQRQARLCDSAAAPVLLVLEKGAGSLAIVDPGKDRTHMLAVARGMEELWAATGKGPDGMAWTSRGG